MNVSKPTGSCWRPRRIGEVSRWAEGVFRSRCDPGGDRGFSWRSLSGLLGAWLAVGGVVLATHAADTPSPASLSARAQTHWAFQALPSSIRPPEAVSAKGDSGASGVDRFLEARLHGRGLSLGPPADAATRLRRMALVLTGLPPTPEAIAAFTADHRPEATESWLERFLASPAYGERWAQHWLDAVGYADSNGYFNADTDRPLAYRYRDYVVRSINSDKPFDRWIREQLAGDELAGWKPGDPVTPEIRDLLEATHFLRNGQDGTGESDGNPDEVRVDRYYALEACQQIIGSSLLGLTVQCAKCHDHKFEPFTQRDYYALQSFLAPAFPIDDWVKPNDRVIEAPLPGEQAAWAEAERHWEHGEAMARSELRRWMTEHRPPLKPVWEDAFDSAESLQTQWADTVPGDDLPAGSPPVSLGGSVGPAARVKGGVLQLIDGGGSGDRWLSTRHALSWQPPAVGDWIQVSFDLVALRVDGSGAPAERVGYVLAAHDFADRHATPGGNVLIDGNPNGPTSVHLDYPGADSRSLGSIGGQGYRAGHNYGIRITRLEHDRFELQHRVDGLADGQPLTLSASDLPPGGFAFEFCCGRSFEVDQVRIQASPRVGTPEHEGWSAYERALQARVRDRDRQLAVLQARRLPKPGRIAWVSDVRPQPRPVPLLKRGNPKTPGEPVDPAFPAFLDRGRGSPVALPSSRGSTSGRRSAWAQWLTAPGTPPSALLARVTVNRVWQQCWGVGLVETSDNLGLSGAEPSHRELLDWLAAEFVDSGWSLKHLHRQILRSRAFHQSGAPRSEGLSADPTNRGLWRFPVHRLDAESIRDLMLAASGGLDPKSGGPYVPTPRNAEGEVSVDPAAPGARARSLYLQHRRTQVPTLLANFDAPSVVFNCTRRGRTTMPLQSLSLLNSDFTLQCARDLVARLDRECGLSVPARIRRAFLLTCSREPDAIEMAASEEFLRRQQSIHASLHDSLKDAHPDPSLRAWREFTQSLFTLNDCLYLR